MLRQIVKVADALNADRSTAVRWMLEQCLRLAWVGAMIRPRKGRGLAGAIASAAMAEFRASKAGEYAACATSAKRPQAEIKALRMEEAAIAERTKIADRLIMREAQVRRKATPPPDVVIPKLPASRRRGRMLSEADVQGAVERAMKRSQQGH
jgi:hypothetical protein